MVLTRTRSLLLVSSLLANVALAQGPQRPEGLPSYHDLIQLGVEDPLSDADFIALEQAAKASPAAPEVYPPLIQAFALTSDRAWALLYGEVYCNLVPESSLSAGVGAGLFALLEGSIDLVAQSAVLGGIYGEGPEQGAPMSSYYEVTMLYSLLQVKGGALSEEEQARGTFLLDLGLMRWAREQQLIYWARERLPETEFTTWQREVLAAGHFEAYIYWLFRGARPVEYESWRAGGGQEALDAWRGWQAEHGFKPESGDFLRTHAHVLGIDPEIAKAPGYGPWRFGMKPWEVASFEEFGPYGPVESTGGLETKSARMGERVLPASFLFDEDGGLAQVRLWFYAGTERADAIDEAWKAQTYLRECCGPELRSFELPEVPAEIGAFSIAFDEAALAMEAGQGSKVQFGPSTMPVDMNVHAGLFRAPGQGWFTFLFFSAKSS